MKPPLRKRKIRITTAILFYTVAVTAITVLSAGGAWLLETKRLYHALIEREIKAQKEQLQTDLKSRIDSIYNYVDYNRESSQRILKETLQKETREVHDTIKAIYENNKGQKNREEIEKLIAKIFDGIRFSNEGSACFLASIDGTPIFLSSNSEPLNLHAPSIRKEIEQALAQGERHIKQSAEEAVEHDQVNNQQILFIKTLAPYGWYTGCSKHIGEQSKALKEEVVRYVNNYFYGADKKQYIFIHDSQGNEIANGAYPEMIGTNNYLLEDERGIKIIQKQIAIGNDIGEGFLTHTWPKQKEKGNYEKLTFIRHYKQWDWIIGTGIDTSYLKDISTKKTADMKSRIKRKMISIVLMLGAFLATSSLIAHFIARSIHNHIRIFTKTIHNSDESMALIDPSTLRYADFDEFITVLNQKTKRINQLIDGDELTKSYNRRGISRILRDLTRNEKNPGSLGLLLFDLDHFKKINDKYGHLMGDHILVECVAIVKDELERTLAKKPTYLGRFGGEEFIVLMPGVSMAQAVETGRNIVEKVAGWRFPGVTTPVTISCGLAYSEHPSADLLIRQADNNMYQAKAKGRNCLYVGPASA